MLTDFSEFTAVRERLHQLKKYEQEKNYLQSKIKEYEKLVTSLEIKLDMEKEDVEKLTKLSFSNVFYTILGSKQGQLQKEKQEELEASLKLQDAHRSLAEYKQEHLELGFKVAELANAKEAYEALMIRKEKELKSSPETALELEMMEIQISDLELQLKELNEALSAGKGVRALLQDATKSLEKAENWGNWDLWGGGGMFSTMVKHGHIDDANSFVHNANRQLDRFKKELSDLEQSIHLSIDLSGLLTMADFWFDGIIVDWMVQGKIEEALRRVLNVLQKIHPIINKLEKEIITTELQLNAATKQRKTWIEQFM